MDPSLMVSFFAPPMPFRPEELYKHVRELEGLYGTIAASDTNARTAQAKAIVSATDSFLEGWLGSLFQQTLGELGVPESFRGFVVGKLRGLRAKLEFAKKMLAPLRQGWKVQDDAVSKFVEDRSGNDPGLPTLRNRIDHGDVVAQSDLRLNSIEFFRQTACTYLEQVYDSLGVGRPGWLGQQDELCGSGDAAQIKLYGRQPESSEVS